MIEQKVYLGDGAYAKFDGFGIELTTENGICTTNTVYLEPEVLCLLIGFAGKFIHFSSDVHAIFNSHKEIES